VSSQVTTAQLFELGDRLLRSWWTIVAGICIGLAGGVVTLAYMPKVYEATTRIWVSRQEIPEDVVRPTVRDDLSERLLTFRNAVLGQPYLEELIERTFGEPGTAEEKQRLIDYIKASVEVQGERDERSGVTWVSLTYRDVVPVRAAEIVNTLTEFYVEQNALFRVERTERSYAQLEQMANEAKAVLDRTEQELAEFNKKHPFAERPVETHIELIQANTAEISRIGSERLRLEDDLRALRQRLERNQSGSVSDATWTDVATTDPLTERLVLARRELEDMRRRLTDQHPDLKRKEREVADLERQATGRESIAGGPSEQRSENPVASVLEREAGSKQRELDRLRKNEQELLAQNDTLRARIDATTTVAPRLSVLLDQKRAAEEKYRSLKTRAEEIATSRDIEKSDLGEKMEVLEYAKVPLIPVAPDPMQVHMLGLGFGCLLFLGPMLARHLLNPVIGSESAMVAVAEFPLVVTIPRIMTITNAGEARRRWAKNISLSVLAFAVLAASVVWWG